MKETKLIERLEKYQHIIWDWNGTLVDDVNLSVKAMGVLLKEYGMPPLSRDSYREIFGFPITGYYKKLGFDLSFHSMEILSDKFHEYYNQYRISHSSLYTNTLQQLEILGLTAKQSILSAAAQWQLDNWVEHFDIQHHFEHVYGINDLLAASKVDRGHQLIEQVDVNQQETILVGDTDHDLEVGNSLGIDVLLIADGHQSYERLSGLHANVLKSRYCSSG